jgi:hypothetical protein
MHEHARIDPLLQAETPSRAAGRAGSLALERPSSGVSPHAHRTPNGGF